ncbi:MAG TPA: GUN4 domain-containing protein, partial [Trichocoleus sp.]
ATSLYPLQFDQGRLEQARRIWEISPEEAQAIEREETAILYGDIQSAIGADYSRLRELLWQGDWLEADRETERALLRAFSLGQRALSADPSLQDVRLIDQWTLEQLPCLDLITIDQLWSLHSEEHFGFKVQAQIFEELQRQPHDFLRAVGWAEGLSVGNTPIFKSTRSYSDLDFSRQAPDGHLPTWRWCCPSLEGGYVVEDVFIDAFMSRLINTCQLLGQVSPQS